MTTLYKLTHPGNTTRGGCLWGEGIEHTALGGGALCTEAWLHAYRDPLVAVLMDPIHGDFGSHALLWECDGEVGEDDGTKVGCTRLRTLRQIPLPTLTTEQRMRVAIACAQAVLTPGTIRAWDTWAAGWLSGENRTEEAAVAAEAAAWAKARAAARMRRAPVAVAAAEAAATAAGAAEDTAAEAAEAAAAAEEEAEAAAWAARSTGAARSAATRAAEAAARSTWAARSAATRAAEAAAWAARSARAAAETGARRTVPFNLAAIIREALATGSAP